MQKIQSQCDLLKKITKDQEYDEYIVKEKDNDGASVMSSLFYISLRSKKKEDLKLFAKLAAWSEESRLSNPILCAYTVELYFYRTLGKRYEKLEEIHSVPKEHRFRKPTLYGSSDKYLNETLVLEDLLSNGYEDFDRRNTADFEYMSVGMGLIAQFHALSIAYSKYYPEGFKRTSECLTIDMSKMERWFKEITPKMLTNALASAENHRDKLEKYFDSPNILLQLIMDYYRSGNDNVLVHGDFKPSNLMHRRVKGKLEVVVVDFQLVHNANAVIDLMYFIFTATDEAFRRKHYQELLDLYYEKLRASLLRLHVNPEEVYPEKTYKLRLEENVMTGLIIGIVLLPMVLVDKDKVPAWNEGADASEFVVETNALFKQRFNGILNNYVEWGLL